MEDFAARLCGWVDGWGFPQHVMRTGAVRRELHRTPPISPYPSESNVSYPIRYKNDTRRKRHTQYSPPRPSNLRGGDYDHNTNSSCASSETGYSWPLPRRHIRYGNGRFPTIFVTDTCSYTSSLSPWVGTPRLLCSTPSACSLDNSTITL